MASETPKQDEDEEEFNPNDTTSPNHTTPTSLPKKQHDVVLPKVNKRDGEGNEEYRCRQAFVKQQPAQHRTDTPYDTDYIFQFVANSSCRHPAFNQVSPHAESSVIWGQLKDPDIYWKIHTIRDGELLPNHVNFPSRFFQNLFKNRNRLEVNHDVPNRMDFDHTGKVTSRQIVVSNILSMTKWRHSWWPHAGILRFVENVKGTSQTVLRPELSV